MKICLGKEFVEEVKKKDSENEKNLLKNRNSEDINELDEDDVYFHSNAVKNIKLGTQLVNRIYLDNSIVYDLENSINLNLFHSLVPAATATSIIFDKLENQDISNFNLIGYCDANNHIAVYNNNTEYLVLNIRNAVNYAPLSCASFFANYTVLADCVFDNFDTRNTANMSSMFLNCYALRNLDLNIFNTEKVLYMFNMFRYCTSLQSLNVSSFDTSKVVDMNNMFSELYQLTGLNVSNFNTSHVNTMFTMFVSCSRLTSLDISNFNISKVTNLYGLFRNCTNLIYVKLGNFNTTNVSQMWEMFRNCTNLKTIFSSSFILKSGLNSTNMFLNCPSLIGGNGTTYDANHIDAEYARVDGENGLPGYFTAPTPAANNK